MTPPESRAERKERTRAALLTGTLDLLADRSLASVSLREVARTAGIVPTAFYRHFASMDELAVALVEDSMRILRRMVREARRDEATRSTGATAEYLRRQVHENEARFRFLSRERFGGVPEVRRAIAAELRVLASELGADLGRRSALREWPAADLDMVADLIVDLLMTTAADLIESGPRNAEIVADRAARQLRLIMVGATHWRPASP